MPRSCISRRSKAGLALVAAFATLLAVGVGTGTTRAAGTGSNPFPPSVYPPAVFKNLSGKVVWYDTSGGTITAAKNASVFSDFKKLTNVSTAADFYPDMSKFWAAEQAHQVPWSFVEFTSISDIVRSEQKGDLLPIDTKVVPVGKLSASAHDKYAVFGEEYASVLTWNTKKWPLSGPHPTSMADLYNTTKFPGKRCMYKYPQSGATFESALLAAGVPAAKMYPLNTKKAFAELDKIKSDVVWWTNGDDSIRFLTNGECDIGITWNGRAKTAITQDHAPLAITWDGAVYSGDGFAVPKNAPNAKAGQALLAMWILDSAGQRKYVAATAYPTAIKGLSYPPATQKWVPAGPNLKHAILENDTYYLHVIDSLTNQFNAWLAK